MYLYISMFTITAVIYDSNTYIMRTSVEFESFSILLHNIRIPYMLPNTFIFETIALIDLK